MSDVGSITAEAFEILVVRELRKAGIEPVQVRRQAFHSREPGFAFDLVARLECYGHRWRALIECSNHPRPVSAEEVSALQPDLNLRFGPSPEEAFAELIDVEPLQQSVPLPQPWPSSLHGSSAANDRTLPLPSS